MQLARALVGAVIGAILGLVVLFGVNFLFGIDDVWMTIPVALLVGAGVWLMAFKWGHGSHSAVRGALTAVLALATYWGGQYVSAAISTQLAKRPQPLPTPEAKQNDGDEDDKGDKEEEPKAAEATPAPMDRPEPTRRPTVATTPKAAAPVQNPWDYAWLGIAALLAYVLGSSGAGTAPVVAPDDEALSTAAPTGAHPDA
jgi:hypothetical protein